MSLGIYLDSYFKITITFNANGKQDIKKVLQNATLPPKKVF